MGKDNKSENADFRRRAEELLKTNSSKSGSVIFEAEMLKLIHELEVHQIELEMQNNELVLAKERAELAAIEKATDGVSEFTENIINTVREPLLVLDQDLRVVKASRSFFNFFKVTADETIGKLVYDLGNNQWDIPKLRELLETILPQKITFDDFEVEHNFSAIGKRVMLLNARQIKRAFGKEKIILLAIEDITERKLAEESLSEKSRMTSEYLDILLDHTHAPIIIWDSSLVIKRFNHQFEKLSGYNSTEVIDRKIDILFPKDKIDSTLELLKNHLSDEKMKVIEVDILTKDNDIKTVIWNSANILDKEGTSTVATIAQDITERKLAEVALHSSETHLRALVQSIPDLIWLKDTEGVYLSCNTRFEHFFGATEADIIGKTDYDFVDQELADFFRENDRKAMEAGKPNSNEEWVTFAEDGHREFLDTIKTPMYDFNGKLIGVLGIGRDNTQRKLAEQKVRASEMRFRAIFDQAPIAIALLDLQGHPIISNLPLSKMLGYSTDELSEMKFTEFTYPEDINKDLNQFTDLIAGKISGYNIEKRYIHKNGNIIWANLFVTTLNDNNGLLQDIIGMVEDITERKKSEDALLESEIKYRAFFENSMDAILLTSPDGKILSANQASCDMFGYSEDELIKLGRSAIVDKSDSRLSALLDERQLKGKARGEVTFLRKDRTRFPAEISSAIFKNHEGLERNSMIIRDITERKQAEDELRERESQLSETQLVAKVGSWTTHLTTLKVSWSKETYRIFEIDADSFQASHQAFLEFVHPDDRAKVNTAFTLSLNNHSVNKIEHRVLTLNGKTKFVEEYWQIIRDDQGNPIRAVGSCQDITERKQTEKEIAMLAHSLKSINECVSITDLENKILFVNESFLKTYGYELNELIGENISIVRSQSNEQAQVDEILPATIQGEWQGELMNRKKDGSEFPIYLSTTIIKDKDGNPLGLIGVAKDIIERRKIDHEIKFQANLLSNVGQSVIATDLSGNVIYWNNAAEKLYGWSSAEAIGQNIISLTPAQTTLEQAEEIMKEVSGGNSWTGEFLVKRKDGSSFPALVTNAPFFNSKEEIAGAIGISSDITERKLEETELIEAKEKAQESDRLKSAFLANMSHEVRTPLNSIIGFSELLGDPDFEEDQKTEFIQHIVASGNNLLNIISDIMDISKMESGEIVFRKKHINVQKYVSGVYEQFSFQAGIHKHELVLNLPGNDTETEIFADGERLMQIFNNLIGNAFKFTSEGKIEIGYRPKGEMVEFFVKDTGIGIPASYHNIIFERFRQVEDAKTRTFGGNGLGLAITKNLVNLMGGKIRLESEVGEGSTFYFTLPVN